MSGALNPSIPNRISDLYFRDVQNHPFWRCMTWRRQHLDEVPSDLVRLLRCAGVVASVACYKIAGSRTTAKMREVSPSAKKCNVYGPFRIRRERKSRFRWGVNNLTKCELIDTAAKTRFEAETTWFRNF